MRIGILSRNQSLYSTRRLLEAAQQRQHEATVIDTLAVAVEVNPLAADVDIQLIQPRPPTISPGLWGFSRRSVTPLPAFDAIIPRIGTKVTAYGLAVVRQFESHNILTTASSQAIAQSRDKLYSLQLMQRAQIPIPRTAVLARPDSLAVAIRAVGGFPVIIKVIKGTQGRGVILARNMATAVAVYDKLRTVKKQLLVQEFIAEAAGRDTRVIVVGNQCVAAMERHAPGNDFRANLHLGGTAVSRTLDPETEALALKAARAHGLAVAGVDIVNSDRGSLVLEVNSSPGLEGIETVTDVDVADYIVRYLEHQYRNHRNPNRRGRKR